MKVSIQGLPGSYHDSAARYYFGKKYKPVCRNTFHEVFLDVLQGHSDFALVSIENSLFGSINQSYDLLLAHKNLWICGEIYLKVEHCLLGLKNARLRDLREIYSHPVALAQCEDFLDEELPFAERFAHQDTAGSALEVKQWGDPSRAAIASAEAAKEYKLAVLEHGIETHHENYTRFIVLTTNKTVPQDAGKTSLVLKQLGRQDDSDLKPGSLYQTLRCFAERSINITKIESRPIIGKAWHYIFYMDFELGLQDNAACDALNCLEELGAEARVLGSYKPGRHVG